MEEFVEFMEAFGSILTALIVGVDYWRRKRSKKEDAKLFPNKITSKKVYVPLILIVLLMPLILFFLNFIASGPEEYDNYYLYFKFVLGVIWSMAVVYYLIGLLFLPRLLNFPNCKNVQ